VYKGKFEMGAGDASAGKAIRSLQKSEYAQLSFAQTTPDSEVLGGEVVIVINSNFRFQFTVPAQKMNGEKIIVPNAGQLVGN